ncbi:MAG: PilZ domain-containing protein [Planctomycetes bacterium]|nr:PilZ domain-containing protein [Planctomycetota bacterium]
MDAEKILKLSPDVLRELLGGLKPATFSKQEPHRRSAERWPFPGTVEVWLPDDCYGDRHLLATLHNLSVGGLAMRTRRPVPSDTRISLAIHQPEMSCYGHAIVRHCTSAPVGYLVGVEFLFSQSEDDPDHVGGDC